MGKKGVYIAWWVLLEAVLISAAIIMFFQFVNSARTDEIFEKKFLARDISLMIDTVSSVPGDVTYLYTDKKTDLSQYSFTFAGNTVKVSKAGSELDTPYYFYYDASLAANLMPIQSSKQIAFTKKGGSLFVAKDLVMTVQKQCPAIDTKGSLSLVIIDPSDQDALAIAERVKASSSVMVTLTWQGQLVSEDKRLEAISETTPAVISIRTASIDKTSILYGANNKDKSQKLACLIAKYLDAAAPVAGSTERLIMKNTQGVGVLVNVPTSVQRDLAAASIKQALREYNE